MFLTSSCRQEIILVTKVLVYASIKNFYDKGFDILVHKYKAVHPLKGTLLTKMLKKKENCVVLSYKPYNSLDSITMIVVFML